MKEANLTSRKKTNESGTETHFNQALTSGAAQALAQSAAGKPTKKVVALQLDAKEQSALEYLGGVKALKMLLCPSGLCIKCRENASELGSLYDSFCSSCEHERNAS